MSKKRNKKQQTVTKAAVQPVSTAKTLGIEEILNEVEAIVAHSVAKVA